MTVYILVDTLDNNRYKGVFTDYIQAFSCARAYGCEIVVVELPLPAVTV